jgi:hypothetical protein
MIFMPGSHGKLGGKSSGVFLAHNILNSSVSNAELPFEVKVPKNMVPHIRLHNAIYSIQ